MTSEDPRTPPTPSDPEEPERLPAGFWVTAIIFAAFVVVTTGCMSALVFR